VAQHSGFHHMAQFVATVIIALCGHKCEMRLRYMSEMMAVRNGSPVNSVNNVNNVNRQHQQRSDHQGRYDCLPCSAKYLMQSCCFSPRNAVVVAFLWRMS
jgi:hypothetical protein